MFQIGTYRIPNTLLDTMVCGILVAVFTNCTNRPGLFLWVRLLMVDTNMAYDVKHMYVRKGQWQVEVVVEKYYWFLITGMNPILWFGFTSCAPAGGYRQSLDLRCILCTMHDTCDAHRYMMDKGYP